MLDSKRVEVVANSFGSVRPVSATSAHSVLERPITIDQHYGSPRHYLNVRFILALVLSVASLHELVTVPNSSQTRTYCSPGNQRSHTRVQILTAAWCSAGRFQPHAIWIARSRTGAVGRAVGFRHYAGQNGVVAQRSISDREWRRSLVSRSDPVSVAVPRTGSVLTGEADVRSTPPQEALPADGQRELKPVSWPAIYLEMGKAKLSGLVTMTTAAG